MGCSSVIVEMVDVLIPSDATTTFITNWEIMQEYGFHGVEHCEALLACLICCACNKSDVFNESACTVLARLKMMGVDLVVRSVCVYSSAPFDLLQHRVLHMSSEFLSHAANFAIACLRSYQSFCHQINSL
jgi:hypothetical protein